MIKSVVALQTTAPHKTVRNEMTNEKNFMPLSADLIQALDASDPESTVGGMCFIILNTEIFWQS